MKDEIKEIKVRTKEQQAIDNLKLLASCNSDEELYIEPPLEDTAKILYNYITNLKDTLKDREEYCYGLETQITDLQEKNERLKEDFKRHIDRINELTKRSDNLQEENANQEYTIKTLLKGNVDVCNRNKKAIDKLYCYGEVFDREILKQFQKEMLNILQGEDKE